MTTRPEPLFPLFAELETLQGVGPRTAKLLAHLDIDTPRDLLFALPYAVVDRRRRRTIKGADLPRTLTVEVTIGAHRAPQVASPLHLPSRSGLSRPTDGGAFGPHAQISR